jgi:hypothetical protein
LLKFRVNRACVILANMNDWIKQVKMRGLANPVRVLLDVLEPLGPLGAQMLYVAQPFSRVLGASDGVRQLAETLEEPGGIERLRRMLDE